MRGCLGEAGAADLPRPNFRICDLPPSASFPTSCQLIFYFRFQVIWTKVKFRFCFSYRLRIRDRIISNVKLFLVGILKKIGKKVRKKSRLKVKLSVRTNRRMHVEGYLLNIFIFLVFDDVCNFLNKVSITSPHRRLIINGKLIQCDLHKTSIDPN